MRDPKKAKMHLMKAHQAVKDGNGDMARQHVGHAFQALSKTAAAAPPTPSDNDNGGGGGHWIAGAIRHPGALHRELGVPQGQTIPAKKVQAAAHSDNPLLAKRAKLAETLKNLHKK